MRSRTGATSAPVVTFSEPKSISRETTFERDLHAVRDRATLGGIFTQLCEQLAERSGAQGRMRARTIGIKLRFDDFKSVTRDSSLPAHTMDARTIRRAAGECLKRVDLTRRLRLLGVRAGTLTTLTDLVAPLATGRCGTAGRQGGARRLQPAALSTTRHRPA